MNQLKYKQEYIQWFLNFRLKKLRISRLLLKISQTPQLLERVTFVDDITDRDNALLVSARGTEAFPYICRVDGIYYNQPQEAYKAMLDLPEDEPIYLCLVCPTRPVLPKDGTSRDQAVDDGLVQNLQFIWQRLARQQILHEIDQALDKKDQEEFFRLIEKLRRIES